ncbi:MAG: OadG family protein [Odoribacter sp.]
MNSLIMLAGDPAAQVGGYTIAGTGYFVVFLALIVLVAIFIMIPKIIRYFIVRKQKALETGKAPSHEGAVNDANINVAIAMGLYQYFNEQHDRESNIITIHNAQKQYSPWSSKIYGVQNQPIRNKR